MRLQKYMASCGVASRRKCEEYIAAGRVTVNGQVVSGMGAQVEEGDAVCFDGKPIRPEKRRQYLLLNKPQGVVTTLSDPEGRRTVRDLIPDIHERVFPVGRLDYETEGLLLLTNDGALTQRLTHPSHRVDKTYLVWVTGFSPGALEALARPIVLDGRKIAKPAVRCLWQRDGAAQLEITIHEGRNRQIRRMCQAAQLHANRLKRIREGALALGDLPVGAWRYLTAEEAEKLKKV